MYFGVFLLAFLREVLAGRSASRPAITPPTFPQHFAFAALCAVPLLFLAQLATIAYTAQHQIAPDCWLHIQIPVVADLGETTGGPGLPLTSFLLLGIAAAQSLALFFFFCARKDKGYERCGTTVVGFICIVSLVTALFAPAMTSPDVITYTTYAQLGFSSFAKEPHVVELKNRSAGNPCERRILPSAYGPGFIAYLKLFAGRSPSVRSQIYLLRIAGALWFLLLLYALRVAGASAMTVSLTAINPVLIFQYVACAHNDLIGAVLVIAGIPLVKKYPLAAAFFIIAAAQVKLSYALIGIVLFSELAAPLSRIAWAACAFVASFGVSYFFAGRVYFESMWYYDRLLAPTADPLQYILAGLIVIAVAVALLRQRFYRIFIYAFPSLRIQSFFPWYAIWSLPYALLEKKHINVFFILMPLTAYLMESGVAKSAQMTLYGIACVTIATTILQDLRTIKSHDVLT